MFYLGIDERLIPIWPHGLGLGNLYSNAATRTGFGVSGGEGKFMGLTPYGRPAFMDHRYVGCIKTALDNLGITTDYLASRDLPLERWMAHCAQRATASGYDMSGFGDPARVTEPANADFAASTQKLFEETLLHTARQLADCCDRLGRTTKNLCLAGGIMLNCPANSRLANESPFDNIYIVPGCDDSGLAIGAAWLSARPCI